MYLTRITTDPDTMTATITQMPVAGVEDAMRWRRGEGGSGGGGADGAEWTGCRIGTRKAREGVVGGWRVIVETVNQTSRGAP